MTFLHQPAPEKPILKTGTHVNCIKNGEIIEDGYIIVATARTVTARFATRDATFYKKTGKAVTNLTYSQFYNSIIEPK